MGLKSYRLAQASGKDLDGLARLRDSTEATAVSLRALRQQRLTVGDEVAALEGQWSGFREAAIREQRQRAMGKTFETLDLVTGRKFREVSVAAIDDAGVTIRHADGSARLGFADLDSAQQVFFGLEADLALVAEKEDARAVAAYERWIETRMAIVHERETWDSEIAKREELAAQQKWAQLAAQHVAASQVRPLAQAATSVGSRSWGYSGDYSSYRAYRPTYRYIYCYSTPSYNSSCPTVVSGQCTPAKGRGKVPPSIDPKCKSCGGSSQCGASSGTYSPQYIEQHQWEYPVKAKPDRHAASRGAPDGFSPLTELH